MQLVMKGPLRCPQLRHLLMEAGFLGGSCLAQFGMTHGMENHFFLRARGIFSLLRVLTDADRLVGSESCSFHSALTRADTPEHLSREVSRHPQNGSLPTSDAPGPDPASPAVFHLRLPFDSPSLKITCIGLPKQHLPTEVFPQSPSKWFLFGSVCHQGQILFPVSSV